MCKGKIFVILFIKIYCSELKLKLKNKLIKPII